MPPLVATTLANPISPDHLLTSFGLAGLAFILFAECGLLVGFFLPGDTLLFAAGIKIEIDPGSMSPLGAFLVVAPLAAIAGNLVGYWIGYRAGPVVFDRPNSRLFRPEYVARSQVFFDRFGSWTVILGRFVPIVRTVATVMAGVARMRFSLYTLYSIIGGAIWADGVLLLGHQLGKIKFVRDHKGYVDYAVIAVVVLALLPTLLHYLRGRRQDPAR
ncbi:MAG: rane-associated protein [Pseudonocardiales bacterium]|jgi:membrane-associated protein|nr:rane-associated protein [Pseudonocardiales bacterium]